MDFVEYDGTIQTRDETLGVALGGSQCGLVVQREVTAWRLAFKRLRECAFTGLAGAIDDNDRGISQRLGKLNRNVASVHSLEYWPARG